MALLSRVGDHGHGECLAGHDDVDEGDPKEYITTHITGALTVFTNFMPQAIIGTIGETDCGHTTTAITGSDTVFAEFVGVHRIGDVGIINEGDQDNGENGYHLVITSSMDVNN